MTTSLQLSARDRLLVFAPHPDDETLATGALIQSALAAGAALRIVFATDGDNNPWPQRWLERRWRIGVRERARWGERRRDEARAALGVLGVDPRLVRFLGWPDQGLTDLLMDDDDAVAAVAGELAAFAPTHVALPALRDRHPDHSALHVIVNLALLRDGWSCQRLAFVVHGDDALANAREVAAGDGVVQRKRLAMLAHQSQVALSRRRLLGLAERPERFDLLDGDTPPALSREALPRVRIPCPSGLALRRRHDLLLMLATSVEVRRLRFALPRFVSQGRSATTLVDAAGCALPVEWKDDALVVSLPALEAPLLALYAKLDRVRPRLDIFDHQRWHDRRDLMPATLPFVAGRPVSGLT